MRGGEEGEARKEGAEGEGEVRRGDLEVGAVARDIELQVAIASVYSARGLVGDGRGGRVSRSREWYNQKVRQLLYNLRGHQNATLRQRVLSGEGGPQGTGGSRGTAARKRERRGRAHEGQRSVGRGSGRASPPVY